MICLLVSLLFFICVGMVPVDFGPYKLVGAFIGNLKVSCATV